VHEAVRAYLPKSMRVYRKMANGAAFTLTLGCLFIRWRSDAARTARYRIRNQRLVTSRRIAASPIIHAGIGLPRASSRQESADRSRLHSASHSAASAGTGETRAVDGVGA
jgi:hypothetical protein